MKKYLFSSRAIRACAVLGAMAAVALPASSASAATTSSTIFATAQGTSLLGQVIPVLGTRGYYITLPVGSNVLPGETLVWNAIDFTVTSEVKLGSIEILNVYVDPKMAH